MIMPVKTVRKRFFVLAARTMQGMAASRAVLSSDREKEPLVNSREGKRRAERTATGICFSQRTNRGGRFIRVNTTWGIIRGNWVTILMPIIINKISFFIFLLTLLRLQLS